MKKVPTAEEFLKDKLSEIHEEEIFEDLLQKMFTVDISEAMIEFAKLHLEAQKKAILKNAKLKKVNFWGGTEIDKNSIINSYPLDKIK